MAKDMNWVLDYTYKNGKTGTLHYRSTVSYADVCDASQFIANLVINEKGEYKPYMKPYAESMALMLFYTDAAHLSDKDTSENRAKKIESLATIANTSNAVKLLLEKIEVDQWTQILKYANEIINYQKTLRPLDRVAGNVVDIVQSVRDLLKSLDPDTVSAIATALVSSGMLEKVMEVINEGGINAALQMVMNGAAEQAAQEAANEIAASDA